MQEEIYTKSLHCQLVSIQLVTDLMQGQICILNITANQIIDFGVERLKNVIVVGGYWLVEE